VKTAFAIEDICTLPRATGIPLRRALFFTLSGVTTDLRSGDDALVTLEALWQMAYVFRRNGRDKVDVLLIAYQELDRVAGALSAEADRAIVAGGRALTVLKTAT
jgi:hypothetical protein